MKKFLSALLVVLMLASLTVCAFAGDSPSQPSGDGGGYYWGDAPKKTDTNQAKADAEKAAEKAARKAAKNL